MRRRNHQIKLLPGLESLENRQLLHGAPTSEPRAAALKLIEQEMALAQHHQAEAAHARVLATRAAHRAVQERALEVRRQIPARGHKATVHSEVIGQPKHRAVHATAQHHTTQKHKPKHHKARHHKGVASPVTATTTTLVAPSLGAVLPNPTVLAAPSPVASTAPVSGTSGSVVTTNTITSPASLVPTVTSATSRLAVGGDLETTIVPGGITGSGVSYQITPQPLPANMTFDRTTGALSFRPAPGQEGTYQFTITTQGGAATAAVVLPITVAPAAEASTEVSGRVVDENGLPLAGMPVAVGTSTATTNLLGQFTLTGVPANPGPISVGGAVATAQSRQGLYAPLDQMMGRELFANANNVIAQPLILPKIDWSAEASFAAAVAAAGGLAAPITLTNAAMPGFALTTVPGVSGTVSATGWSQVSQLAAAVSAQHLPQGIGGGLFLIASRGIDLGKPVMLSLPNSGHLQPGTVIALSKLNPVTGGHDVVGDMIVSPDGTVLTGLGPMILGHAAIQAASLRTQGAANNPIVHAEQDSADDPDNVECLEEGDEGTNDNDDYQCTCSDNSGNDADDSTNSDDGDSPPPLTNTAFDSDADLVTGDYRLDHLTVAYQSQGQSRDIDLAYASLQASPHPVVEWQLGIPIHSNASSITSVTAQVTLGGVTQGPAVTFNTPGGLTEGQTYNVPMQVDASALATGAYPYRLTTTVNYGSSSGAGASSFTTVNEGFINVVNRSTTPLGAGWSIDGLQQIAQSQPGGPLLVNMGQVGTTQYNPIYTAGGFVQDLAVSNTTAGTTTSTNDGRGNFTPTTISSTGSATVATVAGDFNGDGRPDLAIAGPTSLVVQTNGGSGSLSTATTINLPSGYTARALAAGNFTGHSNGVLDLAVVLANTNTNAYAVAVYGGAGNGTFAAPVVSAAGNGAYAGKPTAPNTIAVGDFNGDGRPDLTFTTDDGLVDIMLAGVGGTFGSASALTLPALDQAIGVTATDYNADGHPDLVVEVNNSAPSQWNKPLTGLVAYKGTGSGTFTAQGTYLSNGYNDANTVGLVTGAFNGPDSGLEVGVPISSDEGSFVNIVPLSPAGVFAGVTTLPIGPYTGGSGRYGNIVAGDFDGAGRPSIALSDGTMQIQVLLADTASNSILAHRSVTFAGTSTTGTGPGSGSGGLGPGGGSTNASLPTDVGMLAAGAFVGTAAVSGFRGTPSETSSIVANGNGTWTRTYPDGTVVQFDTQGREVSEADRNGNTTSYSYVPAGQPGAGALQTMTDRVGLVTTLAYGSSGTLQTITDPAGRVTAVVVDSNGNLTKITDPDGAISQYGYATPANHLATTETNADNQTATAHYNAFGQLTSETLFGGTATTQIAPAQAQGLMAPGGSTTGLPTYQSTLTDADGRTITTVMNRGSHPMTTTDANGATTKYTYSTRGFVATETDPVGRVTSYTYDSQGNVTSITEPAPGNATGATYGPGYSPAANVATTETIAYNDPYGVPTSMTDFLGHTTTFTLDPRGNILRRTDPDGQHEDWTYNAAGQPLTDTSRAGNTTSYTYDQYGRLTGITYPGLSSGSGSGTAPVLADAGFESPNAGPPGYDGFTYDPTGSPWTYTFEAGVSGNGSALTGGVPNAPEGVQVGFVQQTGTISQAVTFGTTGTYNFSAFMAQRAGYNYSNQVVAVAIDGTVVGTLSSSSTTYQAVSTGNFAVTAGTHTVTLEGTATDDETAFLDSVAFHLVSASGSPHRSFSYNAAGDLTATTDERGNTTTATYDQAGRVLSTQDSTQAADNTAVHENYDPAGNLLSTTNANGRVTSYTYTPRNQLATMADPVHQGTSTHASYTYDGVGNLTAMTDLRGNTTTYTYDGDNRTLTTSDAANEVTSNTYDLAGDLITTKNPRGNSTSASYDGRGNLYAITLPAYSDPNGPNGSYVGNVQSQEFDLFDADGNAVSQTDPLGHTTSITYNALNLPTGTTDPLGHTTGTTYDADLNIASTTDGLGHTTTYTYDSRDRLVSETDPSGGGTTSYTYDDASNLTSVTDPVGNVTKYTFDADNRVATMTSPTGGVTTYTYDDDNKLVQTTDADNRTIQYGYDADDRETTEKWISASGGSPIYTMTLTYDANGNVASVQDNFSQYTYTYDAVNRVTGVNNAGTPGSPQVALTYGYDPDGDRTSLTDSLGGQYGYAYNSRDELDLLSQSGSNSSGVAPELALLQYDQAGNLTGMSRYADLAANTKVASTAYTYDAANRLTNIAHTTAGGSAIASYAYTLEAANRLTSETHTWNGGNTTDTTTYGYTNNDQLTSVTHSNSSFANESFSYNQNGNRNASGQTTGTGNEIQSDGTYNYAYDAAGNLISKTSIATGVATVYKWDYRNRLTEVDSVLGGMTTVLAKFTYDAVNRQIEEIDTPNGNANTRWTVYDRQTPLLDFNGVGQQTARYLSVPVAIDVVLARQTSSGVAWYLDDREGSVGDLINNSGMVLDHVDYTAYGQVAMESASAQGDRFKYAGMEYDAAIGQYYDRARYYNPATGNFTTQDPLSYKAGDTNLYRYSSNNPPSIIDPFGFFGEAAGVPQQRGGDGPVGRRGRQIGMLAAEASRLETVIKWDKDKLQSLQGDINRLKAEIAKLHSIGTLTIFMACGSGIYKVYKLFNVTVPNIPGIIATIVSTACISYVGYRFDVNKDSKEDELNGQIAKDSFYMGLVTGRIANEQAALNDVIRQLAALGVPYPVSYPITVWP